MPTNPYFNKYNYATEQNLVEDLVVESIQIQGIDVVYLPREIVNLDQILGDDPNSAFLTSKSIEMYVQTVNGFQGDGDILSKFGLQVRDSASLVVSKKRFQTETGLVRPREGDLIYLPLTKGFFEIKFVEHENPFYQLGKNYVFTLSVELFQYNNEQFDTGEEEIDAIADIQKYSIYFSTVPVTGTFEIGDSVYQYTNGSMTGASGASGADAYGVVKSVQGTKIEVLNSTGKWYASDTTNRYITKTDMTAYSEITAITNKIDEFVGFDNKELQDRTNTDIDFGERNAFGDV
jgi:hypothetical protein